MELINRINDLASEYGWQVDGFDSVLGQNMRIDLVHVKRESEPEDG